MIVLIPFGIGIVVVVVVVVVLVLKFKGRSGVGPSTLPKPSKSEPGPSTTDPRPPKPLTPSKPSTSPKPSTPEIVFSLGNTFPLTFSVDPRGRYLFVPCRNRQQLLFSISNLSPASPRSILQRYKLTGDTVCDSTFVTRDNDSVEVLLGLDHEKSFRSFVLDPASTKFEQGPIDINAKAHIQFSISQIVVPPDASFVAVLSDDTYIRVFQTNGTQLFARDSSQQHNYEISVSSNSEFVAASSFTSEVVVYGVDRDRKGIPSRVAKAFTLSEHRNSVHTIDFDPKTMRAVTGGKDRKFNVWLTPLDWRDQIPPKLLWSGEATADISRVRLSPGGETVAILLTDGVLNFWRKQEGIVKTVVVAQNGFGEDSDVRMAWDPSGKWVFVGSVNSSFIYGYSNPPSK